MPLAVRLRRILQRLAPVALALCLPSAGPAKAASVKLRFATELHCARALDGQAAACLRWFAAAERRARQAAPSFTSRAQCEALFGVCAADMDSRRMASLAFRPILSGIEVTLLGGRISGAEPLVGIIGPRPTPAALAPTTARRQDQPREDTSAALPDRPTKTGEDRQPVAAGAVMTYPVPPHRVPRRLPDSMIR